MQNRELRKAHRSVTGFQEELASLLYRRLILRAGPATVADMASVLEVCHSTVTRQCTGDIPVQARTALALWFVDRDGGRLVLDLLGDETGMAWEPTPILAHGDIPRAASVAGMKAAELAGALCRILEDGRVDDVERSELEQLLPRAIYHIQRLKTELGRAG